MEIKKYPGFEEYKLIEIYPNEEIHYRRGNKIENFYDEDFIRWQDFFCDIYNPPKNKTVALFHCCSWSKPYDFSHIIFPIKKLVDKYPFVHRIVISNVGVVPYEYQMNPSFCTYDFPPLYNTSGLQKNEIDNLRMQSLEIMYSRIYRYLFNHRKHYKKIISYSSPVQYGMGHVIALVCKELGIDFEYVLDLELYHKYSNKKYTDMCEIYKEPEVLNELERCLKRNRE